MKGENHALGYPLPCPRRPRGLKASACGYSLRFPEDEENLAAQFEVYDALYTWCRLEVVGE
jgi:hypothetical protein